jgi:Holliday junction DNA helicase RuvB
MERSWGKGPIERKSHSKGGLEIHIGQQPFKSIALIHIRGIDHRGGNFPHTLLFGNAGLGKTTLAKVLARTLGGRFRFYIGEDLKPTRVHELIEDIRQDDVVFIDEIHSIHPGGAEILYDVAQDFLYLGNPVPSFTLMGATTDAGDVPKPLFDRFRLAYKMQPYSIDELTRIVQMHYPSISENAALACAERCLGTPRLAVNLAAHIDGAEISGIVPHRVFNMLGIDKTGLQPEHMVVLSLLANHGGPMAFKEIVFRSDIPETDLLNFYERHLLKLGYITRTTRGRMITQAGIGYLGLREREGTCKEEPTA